MQDSTTRPEPDPEDDESEPALYRAAKRGDVTEVERLLDGIRLKMFAASPAEPSDCAGCPYLVICPD